MKAYDVHNFYGLIDLVNKLSKTVEKPMNLQELVQYVESNDYSAELALQHALILLNTYVDAYYDERFD